MPVPQTLGYRLRHERELRGLSRAEVAVAVGKSEQTVSLWERGLLPSRPIVAKLAAFLGVSPAYLDYGIEQPDSGADGVMSTGIDLAAFVAESRAAQGLSPVIEDPSVLARIAALIAGRPEPVEPVGS